tara:strand:- start:2552 stop:2818 length:267 start_codon:yes stop_codon:yes gene_type:complete
MKDKTKPITAITTLRIPTKMFSTFSPLTCMVWAMFLEYPYLNATQTAEALQMTRKTVGKHVRILSDAGHMAMRRYYGGRVEYVALDKE